METPPPEPPIRRTTRSALVEIPARMGALSMSDNRYNGRVHTNIMTNLQLDVHNANLPLSYESPAPSPDELVIQARGRRRMPITWSPPDSHTPPGSLRRNLSPNGKERTPIKHGTTQYSPNGKNQIVLRSTPRKRLLMNDPMELSPSPEKKRQLSPNSKRVRLDLPLASVQGPIDIVLKALSHDQLIEIIQGIVVRHPMIEEEIKKNLPTPDLKPINEKLHDLKRNIFKSLPNSRLTSKTDSPAYNRASTHVLAFKKALVEAGRTLAASQQWETVIEFVLMAWEQVAGTPLWDNPPHNGPRKHCFKFLAAQCMAALKKIQQISNEQYDRLNTKLIGFVNDSEEIQMCIKQLESIKKK